MAAAALPIHCAMSVGWIPEAAGASYLCDDVDSVLDALDAFSGS